MEKSDVMRLTVCGWNRNDLAPMGNIRITYICAVCCGVCGEFLEVLDELSVTITPRWLACCFFWQMLV